tara:strand:+ start:271 stop:1704 length:1434 start_codon:yes stop_codon:yes gene_type:complete
MKKSFVDCIISAGHENNVALIDDSGQINYGVLKRSIGQIARVIITQYGQKQNIIVRATPDIPFLKTIFGIMSSGNTPIPIDPDLPKAAIHNIKEKSRAIAVLNPMDCSQFDHEEPIYCPDDSIPALFMFTSGTSGFPKGVIISNDNLIYSCRVISEYLSYSKYCSTAVVLPLFYSYALISQVYCYLYVGGKIRLFSEFRNPLKFAQVANALKLETFCGVPSTYNALVTLYRVRPFRIPSIKVLCSAGAGMDKSIFREIKKIFPNSTFFDNYGMTEAAPRIAFVREDDPRFFEPTCGRPMKGVDVKIVDPETHKELPEGKKGVLIVSGPNVTKGYLNDEQLTKDSFTRGGYLISGDIAYKKRDYIYICGRHDDIFCVGGEKVAPLEIERVLNMNPAIEMSAVAPLPDNQRGNVSVAFLKLKCSISQKEIINQLKGELSMTKIPQRFYEVNSFPTTSNGKMQRKKLTISNSAYIIKEIK